MSNQPVIDGLKTVLADSYALYLKTQNYHWNVTGPQFKGLHELFELQYTDLAAAIDDIAELIRSSGEKAPGTWKAYEALTSIEDGDENADAGTMVKQLAAAQEIISRSLQQTLDAAEKAGDEVVVDAMVGRLAVHRKNRWMLQSSLP